MAKRLTEMTLAELWELFPIELTEHREEWAPPSHCSSAVVYSR